MLCAYIWLCLFAGFIATKQYWWAALFGLLLARQLWRDFKETL